MMIWPEVIDVVGWLGYVLNGLRRVTVVEPFTKPVPLMVNVCALFDPVIGFGLTLLMLGAAGALTWKANCPEDKALQMTSTVHCAAVVPKVTGMMICPDVIDVVGWLG